MIKIGLIGCGFMGGMHAACYKALSSMDIKVVAVADVRRDFAKKAAEMFGAEIYETGMDLINKADVDTVDICLPTDLHTAHAVAAMKAGKNVFIEKPICLGADEMTLLLETERQTGAKVQVGQVIRHWREYVWLKGIVDSGIYGKICSGSFRRLSNLPTWAYENWLHDASRSGTVAVDMHIHDVDFVRYILGEPTNVTACAQRDTEGRITHINSLYNYGENCMISIEACWDYPVDFPFTADFRVKFEKATVVFAGGEITVYPMEGGAVKPELPKEVEMENDIGGNISSLGGYLTELKYWLEGLEGKNDLSIATLSEAIESAKLVLREVKLVGGAQKK